MIAAGWSPSVRLFEAAACAVPVISDRWEGLDSLFAPGREIILADSGEEVIRLLRETDASAAAEMGQAAQARVLNGHTAADRARELETALNEAATAPQPVLEDAL
jgi:spore maturation protein CgeB